MSTLNKEEEAIILRSKIYIDELKEELQAKKQENETLNVELNNVLESNTILKEENRALRGLPPL